jgi:hypothetical protein
MTLYHSLLQWLISIAQRPSSSSLLDRLKSIIQLLFRRLHWLPSLLRRILYIKHRTPFPAENSSQRLIGNSSSLCTATPSIRADSEDGRPENSPHEPSADDPLDIPCEQTLLLLLLLTHESLRLGQNSAPTPTIVPTPDLDPPSITEHVQVFGRPALPNLCDSLRCLNLPLVPVTPQDFERYDRDDF